MTGVERRPLYFGREGRPLFGWLHQPAHSAVSFGLVICNAFGNEAICSQRSVRNLAERAALRGIPTLRFDYDGTGDSAGHDLEPDRLAAWIASARAATDEIKAATGVTHVCVAGIRLGATIATLAALERTDIAGLIAIAPVLSGKAYVRELRLLRRAIEAKSNTAQSGRSDVLQAAGFALTTQTQESLVAVDLNRLAQPPAPHVLVLDRAEMPVGDAWPQHLRTQGVDVERTPVSGYTEMMLDPHETVVPQEIIGAALGWLAQLPSGSGTTESARSHGDNSPPWLARERAVFPQSAQIDPVTGEAPAGSVEESFVRIGPAPELFGIVSVPLSQRRDRAATGPAILLLNAGAVYHVGPNRLYVALARHLARSGYVVLRIDIAGIGDSPVHEGEADNIVYSKFALDDLAKSIDYLRREWGVRDIRAVGLCSGAYHAFKASVARLQLTHAVMINPLTFFWKEGMSLEYPEHRIAADIVRYRANAFRLSSWLKLFRGGVNLVELGQVLARRARAVTLAVLRAPARMLRIPLQDDLPSELRAAAKVPVQLHFVFAATDPGQELLRSQGGRTVQRLLSRGKLKIEVIEGADHTFTDLTARTTLAATLARILGVDTALAQPARETIHSREAVHQ